MAKPKRRWFLRPIWRDPCIYFDTIVALALYGLMLPFLWSRATNLAAQLAVIAYFFVIWLLIAAIVSIPIGAIRGYWHGQAESDRRAAENEKLSSGQAAVRVGGRMVGRYRARRRDG